MTVYLNIKIFHIAKPVLCWAVCLELGTKTGRQVRSTFDARRVARIAHAAKKQGIQTVRACKVAPSAGVSVNSRTLGRHRSGAAQCANGDKRRRRRGSRKRRGCKQIRERRSQNFAFSAYQNRRCRDKPSSQLHLLSSVCSAVEESCAFRECTARKALVFSGILRISKWSIRRGAEPLHGAPPGGDREGAAFPSGIHNV